uniref:Uncharacterized protein n=1 Tax=Amorphochlora amoebiformis TaxID=1561963 RepID=A0A7S0DEI0_9EUKA
MRGSSELGAPASMARTTSTVGIGRPMTHSARSFAPRVNAQAGQQPNFADLPKMALGGMATAKALGLSSVAHAANAHQIAEVAGYQNGDAEFVFGVAFNVFACAVLGVVLGFAMLRLEQVLTAKE